MASIANTNAFGIVTVMDVKAYSIDELEKAGQGGTSLLDGSRADADKDLVDLYEASPDTKALCFIDHMQVATLSTDGPSITINGGKYNNALIKYGKTARCEMTDALGQADALVALGGAEWDSTANTLSITDKFSAPVTLIGKTFVVDKKTGKHVPVHVILYKFLPDSTPSFAFDSGNAATFDLNGDLLAVEFKGDAGEAGACPEGNGVFFSFVFSDCTL